MIRGYWDKKSLKTFAFFLAFSFLMIIHSDGVVTAQTRGISPSLDFGGVIPLTPGSSTTVNVKTSGALKPDFEHLLNMNLVIVLCIGCIEEGTLSVELTKDDTQKDVVSMFIIGYPATPMFVPCFGITPTTINTSTVIDNTWGGFGIVFILSGVNSDATPPYEYELSIKLE